MPAWAKSLGEYHMVKEHDCLWLLFLIYLVLLQREEDKSSLPICIESKLFVVTISDDVSKTDSALYTRGPFSAVPVPWGV